MLITIIFFAVVLYAIISLSPVLGSLIVALSAAVMLFVWSSTNKRRRLLREAAKTDYEHKREAAARTYTSKLEAFRLNGQSVPLTVDIVSGFPSSEEFPNLFTVYSGAESSVYHSSKKCRSIGRLPLGSHVFEHVKSKRLCKVCGQSFLPEVMELSVAYAEYQPFLSKTVPEAYITDYLTEKGEKSARLLPQIVPVGLLLAASLLFVLGVNAPKVVDKPSDRERSSYSQSEVFNSSNSSSSESSNSSGSSRSKNSDSKKQYAENGYCYVSRTGKKFHSFSSCSGMDDPYYMTVDEAYNMGRSPCKKCW